LISLIYDVLFCLILKQFQLIMNSWQWMLQKR